MRENETATKNVYIIHIYNVSPKNMLHHLDRCLYRNPYNVSLKNYFLAQEENNKPK